MKKVYFLLVIVSIILLFNSCQREGAAVKHFGWEKNVGAQIHPIGSNVYYVDKFGATGDGITLNTEYIQQTIDECAVGGGGTVKFIPGIYLTGSLYLKSGVNLHIDKGVVLLGSHEIEDYPVINTRVAGVETPWPSAIINVIDQNNVSVSGPRTIDGNGKSFWTLYRETAVDYTQKGLRWIVDYEVQRPRGILVQNSKNVTLQDFVIYRTAFWAIHILYSQFITAEGITVVNNIEDKGPSTDGIDIDSSSDILVQNCDISCNDDNFCIKAGRDADGLRVNRPTERVVIRDCIARDGGGMFTCGSETSGGIKDIVVYNMKAIDTNTGIRFKSALTRGGTVENIYINDVEMVNVGEPIQINLNWNPSYSYSELPAEFDYDSIPRLWKTMLEKVSEEKGLPTLRNINLTNISAVGASVAINVNATEKSPVTNVNLKNINIDAENPESIRYAQNWTIDDVVFNTTNGEKVLLENVENVSLKQ
ncbi:MAG: glycoside hydrolase family 28 protein [Rikenellaceae bacterium]|nr:glycoside hydrolase family 28 protein [Rikenellaceae bacterium]